MTPIPKDPHLTPKVGDHHGYVPGADFDTHNGIGIVVETKQGGATPPARRACPDFSDEAGTFQATDNGRNGRTTQSGTSSNLGAGDLAFPPDEVRQQVAVLSAHAGAIHSGQHIRANHGRHHRGSGTRTFVRAPNKLDRRVPPGKGKMMVEDFLWRGLLDAMSGPAEVLRPGKVETCGKCL
jgi:hypothetical protein